MQGVECKVRQGCSVRSARGWVYGLPGGGVLRVLN